jgi:hypothetical protein
MRLDCEASGDAVCQSCVASIRHSLRWLCCMNRTGRFGAQGCASSALRIERLLCLRRPAGTASLALPAWHCQLGTASLALWLFTTHSSQDLGAWTAILRPLPLLCLISGFPRGRPPPGTRGSDTASSPRSKARSLSSLLVLTYGSTNLWATDASRTMARRSGLRAWI